MKNCLNFLKQNPLLVVIVMLSMFFGGVLSITVSRSLSLFLLLSLIFFFTLIVFAPTYNPRSMRDFMKNMCSEDYYGAFFVIPEIILILIAIIIIYIQKNWALAFSIYFIFHAIITIALYAFIKYDKAYSKRLSSLIFNAIEYLAMLIAWIIFFVFISYSLNIFLFKQNIHYILCYSISFSMMLTFNQYKILLFNNVN